MSLLSVELNVTPSHASLKEPNDDIVVAEKKKTLMAECKGQKKIVLVLDNYFKSIKSKSNNVHAKEKM